MFPKKIQIETTILCPSRCIMCPQQNVSRPKFMSMALIDKLLQECAGESVTIIPHQMGDPLADHRIIEILKKCKDMNLSVKMSTSGFLLDQHKATELINIGVDVINISLDSINKQVYESIRNISFDKVMENVHYLLSLKRPRSQVWISAVDMFFNRKSRREYVAYWSRLADKVQINRYVQYPNINSQSLPRTKMKNLRHCNRLKTDMIVLSDGKSSKCCIDIEGTTSFGDANNQSIREIWNGTARKDFIEKMRVNKRKKLYPCSICGLK